MVGRGAYGRRRGIPQGYARPGTKGTAAVGYPPEEAQAANATTIRMANVRGTDLHGRMSPLVYLLYLPCQKHPHLYSTLVKSELTVMY